MYKVFIDGSAGTTGLRIKDRLSGREDISLLTLPEQSRKDRESRAEMINCADVAFLCLPDEAAKEAAGLCTSDKTVIIDASTAHRTAVGWTYGFAELSKAHRGQIARSRRIANPGCHASGAAALIYPLVAGGIITPDYPVCVHSVTGYSGGGKGMIADYERDGRDGKYKAPAQYALSAAHKHLPEIKEVCGLSESPVLNPIVADFYSGMVVTLPLFTKLTEKKMTVRGLHEYFTRYYDTSRLISVAPLCDGGCEGGFLYANKLAGRDTMEIVVCGSDDRPQLCACFCNLGKGASGAAIQNMNISLGIEETKGLCL